MSDCFHDKLCEVLGSKHCYYNPPANFLMKYPCIGYNKIKDRVLYADNKKYLKTHTMYKVTVIDEDPDSPIADKISELDYCELDRIYVSDNLYHFVYIIYDDKPRIKEEKKYE